MPIYEYFCLECGHSLEAIQKLADAPLTDCPECGKPALKKQVSAPAFRLSGGGWYETDFKTGDKKNIAGERSDTAKSQPRKPNLAVPQVRAPKAESKPAAAAKTDTSKAS